MMNTLDHSRTGKSAETSADLTLDRIGGFSVAEYFHRALYLERRRRERSLRPMLLMLIDVSKIPGSEHASVVTNIAEELMSLTRETDIKGWHSDGAVIGIIFTEFNRFDKEEMRKKVCAGLARCLTPAQFARIDITLHVFPLDRDDDGPDDKVNTALYPDVKRKVREKKGSYGVKRVIDILGSMVGLVVFSPFFLIISILVKLTSPGPVLFRQERVGLYGNHFTFLKFRTMYMNNDPSVHQEYVKTLIAGKAESGNGGNGDHGDAGSEKPVYKIKNDARVTRTGHMLRKTSLDELPQFINVLRGEMSLVGPRPPIPYEVERYDIWHRRRIFEVKPGITGLWQVMGRSSTTFDEMVRLDIKYSREWTVWLDLKILAMTPWAVLRGKGAY